ncbi:MAG TPA: NUDIX domain-containing protein [Dehalococcoidia bacterium]|nr:NUDIX domain-containing protein [Dehalococcoidia bacterium]
MSEMVWMLIENDGAVLLAQRKPESEVFAGRWTLPGEVRGDEETDEETLARVAADDFGVELQGEEFVERLHVSTGGRQHQINVYRVGFEGSPKFRESGPYEEVGWAAPAELDELDIELPEALRTFLGRLSGGA